MTQIRATKVRGNCWGDENANRDNFIKNQREKMRARARSAHSSYARPHPPHPPQLPHLLRDDIIKTPLNEE